MENDIQNLFNNSEMIGKKSRPDDVIWYFVSNHVNFLTMLSAGLLMSPKGYGDKYFSDVLNSFPGWIPLFSGSVPQKVIDESVREVNYLIPCIAVVTLKALRGQIVALYRDGSSQNLDYPDGLTGTEVAILVPAPLPSVWIDKIVFRTKDEKAKCESLAKNCSNVPLINFKKDVDAKLYSKASNLDWPPSIILGNRDVSPDLPLVLGGMMAMLYQYANLGESAVAACRLVFDGEHADESRQITDQFEQSFSTWLKCEKLSISVDIGQNLFWKIVDLIVSYRSDQGVARSYLDVVLDFLETEKSILDGPMREHLTKLIDDLRSLAGFAASTLAVLLKKHPKYFSRALILFFMREKCSDLIEFEHPDLKESDYIAAAILFAARDGWIDLPLTLRGCLDMEAGVSYRMAAAAHRISQSGLVFNSSPPRVIPYRELFSGGPKTWNAKQKEAALLLAHESKWDCIQTKITLGKGDYQLTVDSGSAHIIIPGEVKAVVTEVDYQKFMRLLSETKIGSDIDNKIRQLTSKGMHS